MGKQSLRYLWNNDKSSSINAMRIPEEKEKIYTALKNYLKK